MAGPSTIHTATTSKITPPAMDSDPIVKCSRTRSSSPSTISRTATVAAVVSILRSTRCLAAGSRERGDFQERDERDLRPDTDQQYQERVDRTGSGDRCLIHLPRMAEAPADLGSSGRGDVRPARHVRWLPLVSFAWDGAGCMDVSREAVAGSATGRAHAAGGIVLLTLASAQFLMTLDSSVMNVSIATVAKDVGTTVTGIQTAITFYTLVMASLMITGGKLGQILGRKRAFAIGCVIYGCGSLTTALAGNLAVLIVGWSVLEGAGAALILPAIVALVASNFARDQRPRAYGLVASAGAIAVAAGPLIGGLFTTYLSWRWVFVGEVLIVLIILGLARRMADTPAEEGARLDVVGTVLSALGLGPGRVRHLALRDVGFGPA